MLPTSPAGRRARTASTAELPGVMPAVDRREGTSMLVPIWVVLTCGG